MLYLCRVISNEKDYIESDKSDSYFGIENLSNQNLRNSEDENKNPRGNELLDVCKLNDMLIINGRKTGDLIGKYTCHNWNGSSLVDYLLEPNQFYNKISNFSIGKYIPWLSDHCIIKTTILLNNTFKRMNNGKIDLITLPPGFIWNENSKYKYRNGLQSQNVANKIHDLLRSPNLRPVEIAVGMKDILMNNAKTTKLSSKKSRNTSQVKPGPWFDEECKKN